MALSRSPYMQSRTDAGTGLLVLSDQRFFGGGNVFFVQSTHANAGDSAGKGQTPDAPFSTINYARSQCTAAQGDVIVVLPGHIETVTAAAGLALSVAAVRVLGVGSGRNRPRVNFTTAVAASCDISAANVRVENIWFTNTIDAQTAMINVTAADAVITGCEIQLGDATTQTLLGILTSASADRLRVEANHFHGSIDAGVTGAIRFVGGDSIVIKNNIIEGVFAVTGAIENVTTAATMVCIDGNLILNRTADGDNKTIVLVSTTTGLITNNRGGIIDSTSPAPVTAAGAHVAHNYWSTAAGVTASVLM